MPSKRRSKAGPAPVAPTPQAKAAPPPAPPAVHKQSAAQQPSVATHKSSQAVQPSITKRQSLVQEQLEILSVLMDAGHDWKPRNKVVKKFTPKPKPQQKQVAKAVPVKATTRPTSAKPAAQKAHPTPVKTAAPIKAAVSTKSTTAVAPGAKASAAPVKRLSLNAAQQQEQHEILSVLMDAGSDWKPRNRVVRKVTPKPKMKRPATTPKPKQQAPAVTRKASLSRTKSLTDAQKKEKREIMEILLEYYDYVPHIPTGRPSSIQGHVDSSIQFAHDGNAIVISGSQVQVTDDSSGFQTVKSRRTSHKEKKDAKAILNVLVDFKEPPRKAVVPPKKNHSTSPAAVSKTNTPPTKASIQANKAAPVQKHIQANKTQVRAKLAT